MLPDIHRATQKFYIFLIVYLTGCTPFFTDSSSRILLAIRPQISSLRGAVLWLGQNQNIMLDNFEIFQKVMAFQKMNTSKQAFSKFLSRIAQKKLKKNGFTIRLNFIPLCCGVLTVTSRDRF